MKDSDKTVEEKLEEFKPYFRMQPSLEKKLRKALTEVSATSRREALESKKKKTHVILPTKIKLDLPVYNNGVEQILASGINGIIDYLKSVEQAQDDDLKVEKLQKES